MEFKEFYKKYMRMCKSYENCEGCPRDYKGCLDFGVELNELDELENDVEQWSKEHPQRTRLQDFREKYPNAEVYPDGQPVICCARLGYREYCLGNPLMITTKDKEGFKACFNCWNMPVEEDE